MPEAGARRARSSGTRRAQAAQRSSQQGRRRGEAGRVTRGAGQWGARPRPSLLRAFAALAASREPRGVIAERAAAGYSSAAATRGRVCERRIRGSARGHRRTGSQAAAPSPALWASGPPVPGRGPGVRQVQVGEARRGRTAAAPGAQWAGRNSGWGARACFWACGRAPAPLFQAPRACPRKCQRRGVSPRTGRVAGWGRWIKPVGE